MTIFAGSLMLCALVLVVVGTRTALRSDAADSVERVLLLGVGAGMDRLADEIAARPAQRWRVLGVVANLKGARQPPAGPWLGPPAGLARIVAATRPTRIVIGADNGQRRDADGALLDARMRGVLVQGIGEALESFTGKLAIEHLTPRSLISARGFLHTDTRRADPMQVISRVASMAVALAGTVLLLPFVGLIAVAVVLDSTGPAFFTQARIGIGGRPFRLLKFRTMHGSAARHSEWVSDNAHRITRVGRWLRRFRLDELPQLINVLRGEMNLVGPRPHPVSNAELFLARIPHYRLRLTVRPGITGWAQVRYGYANSLEEETEKMRYDLYYIKHRTIWLDAQIMVETARLLVFDRRSHEQAQAAPAPAVWTTPNSLRHGALRTGR